MKIYLDDEHYVTSWAAFDYALLQLAVALGKIADACEGAADRARAAELGRCGKW